jgi:hypothetical protein
MEGRGSVVAAGREVDDEDGEVSAMAVGRGRTQALIPSSFGKDNR